MVRCNQEGKMGMAKRRSSARRDPEATKGGIQSPFPSSPSKPPKYTLYISDQEGRVYTPGFTTCFGAKKAVDYLLEKDEWEWIDRDKIKIDFGEKGRIEIKCAELEEIVEYEWLNEAEEAWELPDVPYRRDIDRLCGVKFDPRVSEESQRHEAPEREDRDGSRSKDDRPRSDERKNRSERSDERTDPRTEGKPR